jgi:hypothetical protein
MGTGAEDSDVTYQNDAYTQFKNLESGYWLQFLPQLGFTGPTTKEVVNFPGTLDEERTTTFSDEAWAAIQQFKAQGYDVVINPNRIDSGSKSVTEFGFKTPDGKIENTWEYRGGAWYEQMAPYLGLVLPGILGMAGISAGSLGASITGQTSNALLNNAVGGAIIGGAKELITSGGDFESAIKGALTGGALGAAAELAQPYIKDAANALSNLTGEEVAQLAGTDVAATDVAGNVGDVYVGGGTSVSGYGGAGDVSIQDVALGADPLYGGGYTTSNVAQAYNNLSPAAKDVFDIAVSQGSDANTALIRAASADAQFAAGGFTGGADTSINALAGGGAIAGTAGAAGAAGSATGATGATNALAGGDVVSTQVTPTERIATVETNALPELPLAGTTGVGVTDAGLGAAAAGAGAVGAAGAAGAAGAGGVMTEADLEGLSSDVVTTPPVGTDVLGGTDATGGGVGAGAATGAITAGGAAATGFTGIKAVDDFLSYLGTPAGATALSAFGGLAGGYFQGEAAKEAARTQATAAQNALALQREMFDYQKGLLEPYQQAGTAALGRLTGVMGLGGQPATGGQQMLEMDPGYAFRLGEGMKALERLQAARGNMLSGGAIKAGQRFAQDVASQEYGSAYNRLANIAGLGQTTGAQLGAAGQQFGATAGETMAQQANALAAGRVGRTSAYTQGINTAANAFGNFANQQQQNQLFRDIYGRAFGG